MDERGDGRRRDETVSRTYSGSDVRKDREEMPSEILKENETEGVAPAKGGVRGPAGGHVGVFETGEGGECANVDVIGDVDGEGGSEENEFREVMCEEEGLREGSDTKGSEERRERETDRDLLLMHVR